MEEKDLQAGNPMAEPSILTQETHPIEEQITAVNMQADGVPVNDPARAQAPNAARERLREAVLDQGQVKASNFMRHGGLFEEYEITNAKEMPFFMRVFAASALVHLVIFVMAMQLPAMVATTCESTEFTQRLCDTIYVASLVRTDRDFVDQPYDPTIVPDAINGEDVIMVTTADFPYPDGYWDKVAEIEGRVPDETAALTTAGPNFTFGDVNGTGTGSSPSLDLSKPPVLPRQNPGAVSGGEITSPFTTGPNPPLAGGGRTVKEPKGGNKNANIPGISEPANPNNNTTAQNTNKNPVPALPEDKFNKRSLYEFRDKIVDWRETGQNNLYQPFQYQLAGTIDKDGKLAIDEKSVVFNGDPKMQEIIKAAIASFSDSGMLKNLKDLESKSVKITMAQDGNQFLIRLETAQGSEKEARSLYNGLNFAIEMGKMFVKDGAEKEPDPANKQKELTTLELLKMAQLKRDGNNIIIDFAAPNKFAEDMYQTYKKDQEEKKSNPQGIAVNANKNATAK